VGERCFVSRILPDDIVEAYRATGVIPIRMSWITTDTRGGCAIDTLARHLSVRTDELRRTLDTRYEEGFLYAWDADNPIEQSLLDQIKTEDSKQLSLGYSDGIKCRTAVEEAFSSEVISVITDNPTDG
jgi:hypothetical protein